MKKKFFITILFVAIIVVLAIVIGRAASTSDTEKVIDPDDISDGYWDLELVEGTMQHIFYAGDYGYVLNSNDEAAIASYTGESDRITIPSEIDGYQVTRIAGLAFNHQKLKSVSIAEGIQTIGEEAFSSCEITDSLELPENVTILRNAFSWSALPPTVIIPPLAIVKMCAFDGCKGIERVFIDPEAILEGDAFRYCHDLTQIVCAEGSQLETEAFKFCSGIKMVVLCGDAQMEEDAFYECGDFDVTTGGEYETLKQAATDSSDPSSEEIPLEIMGNPATSDGVTVTLKSAFAQKSEDGFTYTLVGSIGNNSDEGIMQVNYTIALIDDNGEEFDSVELNYDGEDAAIPPQSAVDFSQDNFTWFRETVPAAVRISISSVKSETELPPVHVPKAGEYLYQAIGDENLENIKEEPPVEIIFHVDHGGNGMTAVINEGNVIDRAIELFCEIRIREESGVFTTDNYNGIGFKWKDGSDIYISLNLANLEYSIHSTIHTYELEHLDGFWSFCADYLEKDRYEE